MPDREKQHLVTFLQAQRDGVVEVLDGLSDDAAATPVVPPGWTPLGVVEQLGHAEWHWFQQVVLDSRDAPPWTFHPEDPPLTTRLTHDEAVSFYRERATSGTSTSPGSCLTAARDRAAVLASASVVRVSRQAQARGP